MLLFAQRSQKNGWRYQLLDRALIALHARSVDVYIVPLRKGARQMTFDSQSEQPAPLVPGRMISRKIPAVSIVSV